MVFAVRHGSKKLIIKHKWKLEDARNPKAKVAREEARKSAFYELMGRLPRSKSPQLVYVERQ